MTDRARIEWDRAGLAQIERAVVELRGDLTDDIAADARRYAPKDTGELAASIQADRANGRVTVGTDHNLEQEYGTEHQPGTPFMRPALFTAREGR